MEFTRIVQKSGNHSAKKRSYVSKSKRQRYIQSWKSSALSQTAFCQEYGLNLKTFSRWITKEKSAIPHAIEVEQDKSTPVLKPHPPNNHFRVEFKLPNQIDITLINVLHPQHLISIIEGISRCKFN